MGMYLDFSYYDNACTSLVYRLGCLSVKHGQVGRRGSLHWMRSVWVFCPPILVAVFSPQLVVRIPVYFDLHFFVQSLCTLRRLQFRIRKA